MHNRHVCRMLLSVYSVPSSIISRLIIITCSPRKCSKRPDIGDPAFRGVHLHLGLPYFSIRSKSTTGWQIRACLHIQLPVFIICHLCIVLLFNFFNVVKIKKNYRTCYVMLLFCLSSFTHTIQKLLSLIHLANCWKHEKKVYNLSALR